MIIIQGNSTVKIQGGCLSINNNLGGSILLSGTSTSYLTITNDVDFQFETGDFTVEWFQYQTDSNMFTRPWSQGSWPSSSISVSLEMGNFYYWEGGILIDQGSIGTYKNIWTHFAISRSGSIIKTFKNGVQFGPNITSSFNYTGTDDLCIGNQTDHLSSAAFGGNMTNFRWTKGTSIYTSNFQVPTRPLQSLTNTKLLLLSSTESTIVKDSSSSNKTVNYSNINWSSSSPF